MQDITAETVALTFVSGWVARFGVPSSVTTDRGRQFESHLWRQLTQLLGCNQLRTTACHPIANGIIERFHRQLKSALKAHGASTHWVEALPLVLLSIRTAVKSDLQCSVAELVYGTTLRLPGEFFEKDALHTVTDPAALVRDLRESCVISRHPQFAHSLNGMSTSAETWQNVRTSLSATVESANLCSPHTTVRTVF
jgi:transposase InsO family protein